MSDSGQLLEGQSAPPVLKWPVLIPFAAILLLLAGVFVAQSYLQKNQDMGYETKRLSTSIHYLYRKGINDHAEILAANLEAIISNELIAAAMLRSDRDQLLKLCNPTFASLKKLHGITHFYFHRSDAVNLLRLHQPERSGDLITRHTMQESRRSGHPFYGLEIGPLGTFTLRYVHPWYVEDGSALRLIGYVELGMEVEHLFAEIEQMMDLSISVFINKQLLNRHAWEEGVRMLGREPNWHHFDHYVVSALHIGRPELLLQLQQAQDLLTSPQDITVGGALYRTVPVPLHDISDQQVGFALAFLNISAKTMAIEKQMINVLLLVLVVGIILFVFFYRLLDATERRLIHADGELRKLATHDGLTGLLNHRMFQHKLEEEVLRAARFDENVSLLMLDLDHFKQVNDNFGHHIGDAVLKHVAEVIQHQCRSVDTICRYGGEEIAIILPETPLTEAIQIAQRICEAISIESNARFGEHGPRVTASIGVSTFPVAADTPTLLLQHADAELYRAKSDGRNCVRSSRGG